ncbi:hypothetical protein RIR_jg10522.t1 [Rhizophagus irregularis DAOM 181602=DAOM 197198]|nr:hypothetical protein RIR_jg10522.t1 [Rhizophagus irregularis DAOM 181602=DAOM 197198]
MEKPSLTHKFKIVHEKRPEVNYDNIPDIVNIRVFEVDFFKLLYGLNRRVEILTAEFSSLWARIFEWIRSIFRDT